ncbi:ABC transporter permease subunit [Amycolatopsis sp. NPDC054798]
MTAVPLRPKKVGLTWLTYRQHRWTVLSVAVVAAAVAAAMIWTHRQLGELITGCRAGCSAGARASLDTLVGQADIQAQAVGLFAVLIAVFWAAPMISREYEQRTHLLVWTQEVSPTRWLFTKTALLAAVAAALAAGLGVAADGLAGQLSTLDPVAGSRFTGRLFEAYAVLQVVYVLFAFAVGLAVSALVHRTDAAMALSLLVFVVLRMSAEPLRSLYRTPERAYAPLDSAETPAAFVSSGRLGPDPLVLESGYASASGDRVPVTFPMGGNRIAALHDHGITQYVAVYQPGSRLELFRLCEAGIFAAATAALLVFVWLRIRRLRSLA